MISIFKRKQIQEQLNCTFPFATCQNTATHKDTYLCDLHHDEAINGWPHKDLVIHLQLVREYKDELWFHRARQTKGAKAFEKEMLDLLAKHEAEQQAIKKKYSITDKYYNKFLEKYHGKK